MKSADKRTRLDWERKEQAKRDRMHEQSCMHHMDNFGSATFARTVRYERGPLDELTPRQRKRLKNEQRRDAQAAEEAIGKERDALGVYGVW